MKNTLSLITIIVLSLITGTQISRAANNSASTDLRQSAPKLEISAQDSADALRNLVAVSPETPRGRERSWQTTNRKWPISRGA